MTQNTTIKSPESKWVHAVGNRWDTGCNETFCGITNLKKRKYLVVSTDWHSERVTCPHCMDSPAYRERMAKRMVDRMTQTAPELLRREVAKYRTFMTGPE